MDAVLVLVTRWLGVVLAVGGTVVTAPDGWNVLWRGIADRVRRWWRWLRSKIPWLRGSATVRGTASGAGSVTAFATASGKAGLRWDADAPVGEKIALLRQHVVRLESEIQQVRIDVRNERTERKEALSELERVLRDDLKTVEAALHEHRQRAAEIDARGLPLFGWGILLTGVPEQHLSAWSPFGWLLVLIGVALGFGAVRRAVVGGGAVGLRSRSNSELRRLSVRGLLRSPATWASQRTAGRQRCDRARQNRKRGAHEREADGAARADEGPPSWCLRSPARATSRGLAAAPAVARRGTVRAMTESQPRVAVLSCDGACRHAFGEGEGPSGYGFVLTDEMGTTLRTGKGKIGLATNKVAEYQALLAGLRAAADRGVRELVVRMDSELVIKQMRGEDKQPRR